MGDPSRMIVLEAILREVEKEGLQDVVRTTGSVLLAGLKELQVLLNYTWPLHFFDHSSQ